VELRLDEVQCRDQDREGGSAQIDRRAADNEIADTEEETMR